MHRHDDGHGHGGGHAHGIDRNAANRKRLIITLVLVGGYMVAEVIGGLMSNSLALLADAGHMLTDAAALALSLFAMWIASRPPNAKRNRRQLPLIDQLARLHDSVDVKRPPIAVVARMDVSHATQHVLPDGPSGEFCKGLEEVSNGPPALRIRQRCQRHELKPPSVQMLVESISSVEALTLTTEFAPV